MRIEPLVRRLEQAGLMVAAACLAAVMLIICWDAAGRYLAGRPLRWAFDLIANYLLVIAAWLAVAATFRGGDHISIDLVRDKLPRRWRAAGDVAASIFAVLVFAGIAWGALAHAAEAWRNSEFYPGAVRWPVWLSYAPIPIGAALLLLRLAHHIVTLLRLGDDPCIQRHDLEGVE